MLKINKNINFDTTSSNTIFELSMYGYCDFDLNNNLNEEFEYNKQDTIDYIRYLLYLINLYNDKGISQIDHPELKQWYDEIEKFGIKLIKRKDLKKFIK